MSKIADAIGAIVEKKLNGLLLGTPPNGAEVPAKMGRGRAGAASDPVTTIGDEIFTETSRDTVTTQVFSEADPELYVEVTQPIRINLTSKTGRAIELNLKEPVQE